jgi:hypothetical protein
MKPDRYQQQLRLIGSLGAVILLVALGMTWLRVSRRTRVSPRADTIAHQAAAPTTPAATSRGGAPTNQPAAGAPLALGKQSVSQERPFPVVQESATLQWTAEDGKDPNVVRRLAHNDLEYQRMVDENARIFRRQLVYLKETAAALIERSKLTGVPVRELVLPGLDGQEIQFEVTAADLSPSGQQGSFSGHIAGRPDSMVTMAFKGGREAFTALSPADNLYLVGEPHEPGELIVKSINPETYVVGVSGNP